MTRRYDLTCIVRADTKVTTETLGTFLKELLGKSVVVVESSISDKRPLAYEIKKQMEGKYISAKFDGQNIHVHDIEKKVQLGTEILRFLVTVKPAVAHVKAGK